MDMQHVSCVGEPAPHIDHFAATLQATFQAPTLLHSATVCHEDLSQ